MNQVTPNLQPVALGAFNTHVELSYPKYDTWEGSTNAEVAKKRSLTRERVTVKVQQKTVDDYFPQIGTKATLMKLDTEGNELSVLQGATETLRENRPMIIFECDAEGQRTEVFDFLVSQNYMIFHLPWTPAAETRAITGSQFVASSSKNFIAIPIQSLLENGAN